MHSESNGQREGPQVCGPSLGTAGLRRPGLSDDRGGVVILSQPSIQETAAQVAWPYPSQVPRSPKGREQRVRVRVGRVKAPPLLKEWVHPVPRGFEARIQEFLSPKSYTK